MLLPVRPTTRAMALMAEAPAIVAWVMVYLWYKADVSQRRLTTSTSFNGLVIALGLVALPGYFVRTRGLARGAMSTIIFYAGILGWSLVAGMIASVRHAANAG